MSSAAHDPTMLPAGLPVPQDDGACDHLGRAPFDRMPPEIGLECTDGTTKLLSGLGNRGLVLFFYPRTGVPGQASSKGFAGEDWDEIPGARGCTPQACGFRDAASEFAALGVDVFGISTSTREHQREFKHRQHMPFEFLSDSGLRLTHAMHLPTFEFPVESGGPQTLIRRMAWYLEPHGDGAPRIVKIWYPVYPSSENARVMLNWLRQRASRTRTIDAATNARRHALSDRLSVRPIRDHERGLQGTLFSRHFGGTRISSRGHWLETSTLPTLVCEFQTDCGSVIAGIASHTSPRPGCECELVALASVVQGVGAGSALLEACVHAARAGGASRILLTTSNDNVDALRFYQLRGWRLAKVYPGVLAAARRGKPQIPSHGPSGVEVRDDLELEIVFGSQSQT